MNGSHKKSRKKDQVQQGTTGYINFTGVYTLNSRLQCGFSVIELDRFELRYQVVLKYYTPTPTTSTHLPLGILLNKVFMTEL